MFQISISPVSALRQHTPAILPKIGVLAITATALYILSKIPAVLGGTNHEYEFCLAACRGQYGPNDPEIIRCFQRCRQYYSGGFEL